MIFFFQNLTYQDREKKPFFPALHFCISLFSITLWPSLFFHIHTYTHTLHVLNILWLCEVFLFQSSKIKKGCKGDASVLKPTLMAAVPVSTYLALQIPYQTRFPPIVSLWSMFYILRAYCIISFFFLFCSLQYSL